MNEKLKTFLERAKRNYELKELERLGLSPDMDQRELILSFFCLIYKWNKVSGLISKNDEDTIFLRHFCDSIQPLLLFGFKKNATVLDIGSGGGFPAIPVRIFRPDLTVILTESNKKKAAFLSEVKKELKLENVQVFNSRVEKYSPDIKFDYVMSRGVSSLMKFAQLARPHVAKDGRMYTFKTKHFEKELSELTESKGEIGVSISEIAEYDLGNQIHGLNLIALSTL